MGRFATDHPELLKEWNYEKNGDLKPGDVTSGSNKKAWWKCDRGHEWQATVYDRSSGHGCPYCSGRKAWPGFNDLATLRPDLAAEWHPTKNGGLSPRDVTVGSHKKVWWECDKGHEWQTVIENRSRGYRCPYCSGRKVLAGYNDLATINPDLAAEWHPAKNGDLSPRDVTAGSHRKVWWKCKSGHEWQATIGSRTSGNGCPFCAGKKAWPGFNDLATIRPDLAVQWHPAKNGNLKPENATVGSKQKVWWKCGLGHEWQATIDNRNHGYGCPYCAYEKQTSFPEQAIYFYLSQVTHAENRFRIGKYEADIFLPEVSIAIEYDGLFWHESTESQEKDNRKDEYFKKKGLRLIRVKEVGRKEQLPLGSQDTIYCSNPDRGDNLAGIINKLVRRIGISSQIDVDLGRDAIAIYNQYSNSAKENSLLSLRPDLAAEWHPTKNKDLTPENVTPGSHKKVWWKCDKGHEWQAVIEGRNDGHGCPYCSNKRLLVGYNDLATVSPNLASEWNPTKNGDLKPQDVTAGSNEKVWWKCEYGHEWQTSVSHRNRGYGCPYCAGQRAITSVNDLATVNPGLAAEWHPIKNRNLKPSEVMPGSTKKVWWKCEYGHEWQATVGSRNQGRGCPYCSGRKVLAGYNDLATINPDLAAEWHPAKNGDLSPRDVTTGSGKKVWWRCERGHEWQARVTDRTHNKANCPAC